MGCSLSGVGSHRSIATSPSRKYRGGRFPGRWLSRDSAISRPRRLRSRTASCGSFFLENRPRVAHTIKVEVGKGKESSRIVMEGPEVVDAVKGQGYREVESKSNRRKRRLK